MPKRKHAPLEQKLCSEIFQLKRIYHQKTSGLFNPKTRLGKFMIYGNLSPKMACQLSKQAEKTVDEFKTLKPKKIPHDEREGYELMVTIHGLGAIDSRITTRMWKSFNEYEKGLYMWVAVVLADPKMSFCHDVFYRLFGFALVQT